jgi:cold shock protein
LYSARRGFGFIREDQSRKDIFVHFSGVNGQIRENDRVTFRIVSYHSGSRAVEVTRIPS